SAGARCGWQGGRSRATGRGRSAGAAEETRWDLVRVGAKVGRSYGRQGVSGQETRLAVEKGQLRAQAARRIGQLEQLLLASELDLQQAADCVARGERVVRQADWLEHGVERSGHVGRLIGRLAL